MVLGRAGAMVRMSCPRPPARFLNAVSRGGRDLRRTAAALLRSRREFRPCRILRFNGADGDPVATVESFEGVKRSSRVSVRVATTSMRSARARFRAVGSRGQAGRWVCDLRSRPLG